MKLRKTLFVSQAVASQNREYYWEAPYIFYDRHYRKWMQDAWYFDDKEQVTKNARAKGFLIK